MKKDLRKLFDLTRKVAIVTGGTGKLGPHMIETLLFAGASVVSFSLSGADKHIPNLDELERQQYPLIRLRVDVTREDEVQSAVDAVVKRWMMPTILVNNAGIDAPPDAKIDDSGPFETYPLRAWQALLDSHLTGTMLMSKALMTLWIEKKVGGVIVNVSSIYGYGAPRQDIYEHRRKKGDNFFKPIAYTTVKAGILGMTKWLAGYGGPHGIRVNTLTPGGIDHNHPKEFYERYSSYTMLGRMGEHDDLRGPLLFLASDASSYMTGAEVIVDAGWTAY